MKRREFANAPFLAPRHPFALLVGLVGINLLWAGNPVMTKFMLMDFVPLQVAWLRITVGAAVLALAFPLLRRVGAPAACSGNRFAWAPAMALGGIVFFITPLLITYGLDRSLAMHNSFLTGLEPVITIVLAWLLLRERMRAQRWLILAIATLGFILLSGVVNQWMGLVAGIYLVGNLLLVAGMAGEAMYSVLGGKLVQGGAAAAILLVALATGACLLSLYLLAADSFPNPTNFSVRSLVGLLWTGPITTAGCYFFWLASLRHIPVNAAAFTLFVQPLIGAAMGYTMLSERLDFMQSVGAGLILLALTIHTILVVRRPAAPDVSSAA